MAKGIMAAYRSIDERSEHLLSLDNLYGACVEHFRPPTYSVRRDDATSTVWLSAAGANRQVGVQPHLVARRGLDAAFESLEEKLNA